MYALLKG